MNRSIDCQKSSNIWIITSGGTSAKVFGALVTYPVQKVRCVHCFTILRGISICPDLVDFKDTLYRAFPIDPFLRVDDVSNAPSTIIPIGNICVRCDRDSHIEAVTILSVYWTGTSLNRCFSERRNSFDAQDLKDQYDTVIVYKTSDVQSFFKTVYSKLRIIAGIPLLCILGIIGKRIEEMHRRQEQFVSEIYLDLQYRKFLRISGCRYPDLLGVKGA